MRDIKFRAIVNEKGMNKCWIEGSLVHITKTYKGEEDEQECDIFQIINFRYMSAEREEPRYQGTHQDLLFLPYIRELSARLCEAMCRL